MSANTGGRPDPWTMTEKIVGGDLVQQGVLDRTLSVPESKLMIIVLPVIIALFYHVSILILQELTTNKKLVRYYWLALKLAKPLGFIPIALQMMFIYLTSELWSNDQPEKISELAGQTMQHTFLLTGILALGLISLAWLIDIQPLVSGIHLLLSPVIIPPLGLAMFTLLYFATRGLDPGEFLGCSHRSPTRSVHRQKHFKQNTK